MATLALSFLGTFDVRRDGVPVNRFRSDKVRALLAFLATTADRTYTRAALAALLWPEQGDEAALSNLGQTLLRLRAALGDSGAESPLLSVTRATIRWHAESVSLDVADFARLARSADPDDLARAMALYRGEFLQGFGLPDCEPFEEWLLLTREQLHVQALGALHTLARHYLAQHRWTEARDAAQRQIAIEPWREAAHRQLMQALAASGDRAAALAQFARCRKVLVDELGVEPDGETRALYERLLADDLTPATRATAPPRHNLPAALTSFLGRETELRVLAAFRQQGDIRLLTLVGVGGMGKTRLALEVARASLDTYADGVFFVALAPLAAAEAVVSAIIRALGVTLHGNDPMAALLRWVRDKHLLLILDNFEHVLEGVDVVVELLQTAPRLQVIATSRERLNVRGEQVYGVEGLEYVQDALAAESASSAAVHLFVQGARRARPDFQLCEAELPALHRICELVGGMPLGLELAAAWAGLLPVEEIADEITRDVDFLEATWPDAPERQRSMRAVFDWSWRLLSDAERQILCQLSVFRGGFTREAAETVAGATLRVLASLQHKSLLQLRPADGVAGRYELHESLRQFAAEQLEAMSGERTAVAARHGAYYLKFVAARGRRLGRNEPREATAEIRTEIDNVRQAWSWGVNERRVAELAQAAYGWWQFCLLTGQDSESRRTFGLAVERLRMAPDVIAGDAALQPPPRGLSTLLAIHANHLFSNAPYEQMAAEAHEAIQMGAATGDVEGETLGTYVLGRALLDLEQQREAHAMWERTLLLARAYQPGSPDSELLHEAEWLACAWQFEILLFFEDYGRASARVVEALRIAQALGKRRAELESLASLAMFDFYMGDDLMAQQRYEQVLALARALDDRWEEMCVQRQFSEVLRVQGAYVEARTLLGAVVATAREFGILYEEILALATLVRLHCQLGDIDGAVAWREELVGRMDGTGVPHDCEAEGLRACAVYALCSGDYPQALADAEQAWHLAQRFNLLNWQADSAVILGHARAAMNRSDAAAAYEQAVSLYHKIGNTSPASEPQAGLAGLALAQGNGDVAQTLVDAILPVLAERPRARVLTPFYAYAICCRVLTANGDPRAGHVLWTAQERLRDAAGQITDPTLCRSFLEIPAHRELLGLAPPSALDMHKVGPA